MQIVDSKFVSSKVVLLRYDFDVPLEGGMIVDDFRLMMGLPTLNLCLEHAKSVVMMGHLGRPEGKEDPSLSVAIIHRWLVTNGFASHLQSGKLRLLENLRFEVGEDIADSNFASELAKLGEVYVNEAFAAYHSSASTTLLPKLVPSSAGLRFNKEVRVLSAIRERPKKPLVAIIGGAKVEDKIGAVRALSQIADHVLVGGKLSSEIIEKGIRVEPNVFVGEVYRQGLDLAPMSLKMWAPIIANAKMIVWNGPLGKIEAQNCDATKSIAQMVIDSGAESIVGGGDTIGYLNFLGLLDKFNFASTGGGAMLKFLETGTLPSIEALG